jgi:hypothetical protein
MTQQGFTLFTLSLPLGFGFSGMLKVIIDEDESLVVFKEKCSLYCLLLLRHGLCCLFCKQHQSDVIRLNFFGRK